MTKVYPSPSGKPHLLNLVTPAENTLDGPRVRKQARRVDTSSGDPVVGVDPYATAMFYFDSAPHLFNRGRFFLVYDPVAAKNEVLERRRLKGRSRHLLEDVPLKKEVR